MSFFKSIKALLVIIFLLAPVFLFAQKDIQKSDFRFKASEQNPQTLPKLESENGFIEIINFDDLKSPRDYTYFKIDDLRYESNLLLVEFTLDDAPETIRWRIRAQKSICSLYVSSYLEYKAIVADIKSGFIIPFCDGIVDSSKNKLQLRHNPQRHVYYYYNFLYDNEQTTYRLTESDYNNQTLSNIESDNGFIEYKSKNFDPQKHYLYYKIDTFSYSSISKRNSVEKTININLTLNRTQDFRSQQNCQMNIETYFEYKEILLDIKSGLITPTCSESNNKLGLR